MKELSIYITGIDLAKDNPGVGPNSWGYWRILLPCQSKFFEPANEHDVRYTEGCTENDRYFADTMFRSQCLERSNGRLEAFVADLYYDLLSHFGRKFFNYK